MSGFTTKLSRYLSRYLSTKAVFIFDLFLSVLATSVILLVANYVSPGKPFTGSNALLIILSSFVSTCLVAFFFRTYKIIIRHTTIRDLFTFCFAAFGKVLIMFAIFLFTHKFDPAAFTILMSDFLLTLVLLIGARVVMIVAYEVFNKKIKERRQVDRLLVYGTSDRSVALVTHLRNSTRYKIVGFISSHEQNTRYKIADVPVQHFSSSKEYMDFIDASDVNAILYTSEEDARADQELVADLVSSKSVKVLIAPSVDEIASGAAAVNHIREIKIEDLLGREEIKISMEGITANFKDKVIMVTGAAGSIGSELCRQLATIGVKKLVLYDNAETPMHNLRLELEDRFPQLDFVPIIGDVRLKPRLDFAFRSWHPQIVFHAAAYKHVPLMEENPCEAVLVNVYGTKNVADKCIEYGVEKMVMISTDKAVNPTNVMGCTKRLAEIYVQSLGLAIESGLHEGVTKFVTTRFGNVLGSNGSVIPRFRQQIEKGGPVTVTHPDITRFFMTIPEACRLVMEAANMTAGNQIFVFDMGSPVKIDTLARRMIKLAGFVPDKDIKVVYTGLRPGEKLYEEVLSNTENTIPTSHYRIRIAKVRAYSYEDASVAVDELEALARAVEIPAMVKKMKAVVPEFISKNSKFEEFDK